VNEDSAPREPDGSGSGLILRVISASVLIPPVIGAIYLGSPYFEILIALGAVILCYEWVQLCRPRLVWILAGIPYIALPTYALVYIRQLPADGYETVLWIFVLVWAADTGAYASGRLIGGAKLAPLVSPNKTWAGLAGGIVSAGAIGAMTALVLNLQSMIPLVLASAVLGAISQGGDLLESWIKRKFGKKDAGSLIPGHGGLFDRVDGLLAAALGAAVLSLLSPTGGIFEWA